jgi:Tfp pilus assembly major pilin PilA
VERERGREGELPEGPVAKTIDFVFFRLSENQEKTSVWVTTYVVDKNRRASTGTTHVQEVNEENKK